MGDCVTGDRVNKHIYSYRPIILLFLILICSHKLFSGDRRKSGNWSGNSTTIRMFTFIETLMHVSGRLFWVIFHTFPLYLESWVMKENYKVKSSSTGRSVPLDSVYHCRVIVEQCWTMNPRRVAGNDRRETPFSRPRWSAIRHVLFSP